MRRVGVVGDALGDEQQFTSVAALFPHVHFELLGPGWPSASPAQRDLLIVPVDCASAVEVDAASRRLKAGSANRRVVIVLRNADVSTTRLLMREGAADVIPSPATEAALALALDKFLAPETDGKHPPGGEIIAVLKAGGGVGATTLCVQAGVQLARGGAMVCLADLDLQFGTASLYLDMAEAATVSDCISAGTSLRDVAFDSLLGKHVSGLRLLAAPRQVTPLEALAPPQVETLLNALKRSFGTVIVDLPSVWTAWTNRALQMADRIVIVTQLSVPHMHMLDRQISTLRTQGLDDRKLTLVCNAFSADHAAGLSLKAAERALSRTFDVVIPEDRRVIFAATNQGLDIATVRRGTKVEKGIASLAALLAPRAVQLDRRRVS